MIGRIVIVVAGLIGVLMYAGTIARTIAAVLVLFVGSGSVIEGNDDDQRSSQRFCGRAARAA